VKRCSSPPSRAEEPSRKPPANIVPFGKYKGRLIEEVLVDDPGYLQWLAGQVWFRDKFAVLYQVIINRGGEPQDTPEHNALQVKSWMKISASVLCDVSFPICRTPPNPMWNSK
jgi:uncharacterized protein (DUF3820 family)